MIDYTQHVSIIFSFLQSGLSSSILMWPSYRPTYTTTHVQYPHPSMNLERTRQSKILVQRSCGRSYKSHITNLHIILAFKPYQFVIHIYIYLCVCVCATGGGSRRCVHKYTCVIWFLLLITTLVFEWYVVWWRSKCKHHKDTLLKEIGVRLRFLTTLHSIVLTIGRTGIFNQGVNDCALSITTTKVREGPIFCWRFIYFFANATQVLLCKPNQ